LQLKKDSVTLNNIGQNGSDRKRETEMETTEEKTLDQRLYEMYVEVSWLEDEINDMVQSEPSDYLKWASKVTREARDNLYEASSAIRFQKII